VRSKLRTETILAGSALQAALVNSVSSVRAELTDLCFRAPNWVGGSRECSSRASISLWAISFSTIFASVFSRAIGR